jgi:hypothetical protein
LKPKSKRQRPRRTAAELEALWRKSSDFIGPVAPPMHLWLHDPEKQELWRERHGLFSPRSQ